LDSINSIYCTLLVEHIHQKVQLFVLQKLWWYHWFKIRLSDCFQILCLLTQDIYKVFCLFVKIYRELLVSWIYLDRVNFFHVLLFLLHSLKTLSSSKCFLSSEITIQCFLWFGNVTVTVASMSVLTKTLKDDNYDKKAVPWGGNTTVTIS
jgi:hypothetical protein